MSGENLFAGMVLPPAAVEQLVDRLADVLEGRLRERLPSAPATQPFLSVREAATLLRSSSQRIYDLVSAGRLTRLKDGSRLLISREELMSYLRGEATGPVAQALPAGARSRSRSQGAA